MIKLYVTTSYVDKIVAWAGIADYGQAIIPTITRGINKNTTPVKSLMRAVTKVLDSLEQSNEIIIFTRNERFYDVAREVSKINISNYIITEFKSALIQHAVWFCLVPEDIKDSFMSISQEQAGIELYLKYEDDSLEDL